MYVRYQKCLFIPLLIVGIVNLLTAYKFESKKEMFNRSGPFPATVVCGYLDTSKG